MIKAPHQNQKKTFKTVMQLTTISKQLCQQFELLWGDYVEIIVLLGKLRPSAPQLLKWGHEERKSEKKIEKMSV